MRLLAFLPANNEAGKIGPCVARMPPAIVERTLVFDDGSTDNTAAECETAGAVVLRNSSQRGVGNAIRCGIEYARREGFTHMVILAGNGKDDPGQIAQLVAPLHRDEADFVQGSRYLPGGRAGGHMPTYRRLATRYVHPLLFSLIVRRHLTDTTNGFRAFRLTLFDDARLDLDQEWLDRYELEPYLLYKVIRLGYRLQEVPVSKIYPPPELGYTKMRPVTGWWSILRPIVLLGLGLKR